MTRHLAALALVLGMAGCATTQSGASAAAGTGVATAAITPWDDEWDCETEAPTGSHIPEEQCRSRLRKAQERRDAQRFLTRPRNIGEGAR